MITADELVQMTEQEEKSPFKLGTVVGLFENGAAKVQFDGEEEPSEKEYAHSGNYSPVVGDRVLLAKVKGTYVVMNSIIYNQTVQPNNFARVANGTYTGNGSTSLRTINVGFTPKLVICYGEGSREATAKGISIINSTHAIGKYWDTKTHNVGIVSTDGNASPRIINNGFQITHTSDYATLNISGMTYYWVAIG